MIEPDHRDAATPLPSSTTGGTAGGPRLRVVVTLDQEMGV